MKVSAIVPQKALAVAKSRLETALSASARFSLSLGLLRHVCMTLRSVPDVETAIVLTPDPEVRARVASWGVTVLSDPAPQFNAALAQAIAATAQPTRGVLVIAADLPLLQPADVMALLRRGAAGALVLAPSKEGTGTNALLVPPGIRFRPAYGEGSRAAHRREACARGLAITEIVRAGLAFDVDTPEDVAFLERCRPE